MLHKDIYSAVAKGDKDRFLELLPLLEDINQSIEWHPTCHRTLLHTAAQNHHLEVAKILIEAGAALDKPNEYKTSPLSSVCSSGSVEMATLLISAGADINYKCGNDSTPFLRAFQRNHIGVLKLLIASHAEIPNILKLAYLLFTDENKEAIKLLLIHTPDLNTVTQETLSDHKWDTFTKDLVLGIKAEIEQERLADRITVAANLTNLRQNRHLFFSLLPRDVMDYVLGPMVRKDELYPIKGVHTLNDGFRRMP